MCVSPYQGKEKKLRTVICFGLNSIFTIFCSTVTLDSCFYLASQKQHRLFFWRHKNCSSREQSHHRPQLILIFSSCMQLLHCLCIVLHSQRTVCISRTLKNWLYLGCAISFTFLQFCYFYKVLYRQTLKHTDIKITTLTCPQRQCKTCWRWRVIKVFFKYALVCGHWVYLMMALEVRDLHHYKMS